MHDSRVDQRAREQQAKSVIQEVNPNEQQPSQVSMVEESREGAAEAHLEQVLERVLERQLPAIVARLAAAGTAVTGTRTSEPAAAGGTSYIVSLFWDEESLLSNHIMAMRGAHFFAIGPVRRVGWVKGHMEKREREWLEAIGVGRKTDIVVITILIM